MLDTGADTSVIITFIIISIIILAAIFCYYDTLKSKFTKWRQSRSNARSGTSTLPSYNSVIPAPEQSHLRGLSDTTFDEYSEGVQFCLKNPVKNNYEFKNKDLETIRVEGCRAWKFASTVGLVAKQNDDGTQTLEFKQKSKAVQSVSTELPLLRPQNSQFYYEVEFLSYKPCVGVGFACLPYPSFRMPGWHRHSVGLHSDDGRKYYDDSFGGRNCTTPFQKGDVMGVGFDAYIGGVYFTKNGERIGEFAFTGVLLNVTGIFPTIGAQGKAKVVVNFGSKPFRYAAEGGFGFKDDLPPAYSNKEGEPLLEKPVNSE